ncbi:PQQ-binding-like beta-propeller repeat protein [Halobacteriaceae archaeon GCM10025711]
MNRSRRAVLRLGAGALAGASLAGCLGDPGTTTTTAQPSSTTDESTTTEPTDLPDHARWGVETGGPIRVGPTVRDGTVYAGSGDGNLYALAPDDGSERWRFDTGAVFFGGTGYPDRSPLVADGTVYAVSGDQSGAHGDDFGVYAVDAASGEEQWSYTRSYPKFLTLLGVVDGLALVVTSDDALGPTGESLLALDAATGEVRWTAEVGDSQGVAIGAGAVYVAAYRRLYAIDLADGTERWRRDFEGGTVGPGFAGDTVFAGSEDYDSPAVHAFDPATGEVQWSVEGWAITSLLAADALYLGGENVASYAPDGTERWRHDAGGLIGRVPVTAGTLYVGSGTVTALSAADSSVRWTFDVDAEYGAAEAADDRVVAVTRQGQPVLDVLDVSSGDRKFVFEGEQSLTNPDVQDGRVFVGDESGTVYALDE